MNWFKNLNWFRNLAEKVPRFNTGVLYKASRVCLHLLRVCMQMLMFVPCVLFNPTCNWKLFLKEEVYQLLESKRDRVRHVAALTLQRYTRMYFVRKRFKAFRMKIIKLQAHCRGFLAR